MAIIKFAFYTTGVIYTYFKYPLLTYLFLTLLLIYIAIGLFFVGGKSISFKRLIMFSSWDSPAEGIIKASQQVNIGPTLQFILSYPEEKRPELVHVVCKALAEMLKQSDDLNGKIVFGKFYKQKDVRISLMVQFEDNETVNLLIEHCQSKSIEDFRDQITTRIADIKKQKKQNQEKIPTFLFDLAHRFVRFLTNNLNINIPFLGLKRDPYGTSMVHYNCRFDGSDVTIPFHGFSCCSIQMTFTWPVEKAIIENGKPTVAKMMTTNFIVDHRYLDGGKAKKLIPSFMKVFQNPEAYSNLHKAETVSEKQKLL